MKELIEELRHEASEAREAAAEFADGTDSSPGDRFARGMRRIGALLNEAAAVLESQQKDIRRAADALERQQWVGVDERLPEESGLYLTRINAGHGPDSWRITEFRKGYGFELANHHVTLWRYLDPPESEGKT